MERSKQESSEPERGIKGSIRTENSYGELRNQLEEWGEDKKWKSREESNRRANVERISPTIPEEGGSDEVVETRFRMK